MLSIVPCAIQQDLVVYLSCIYLVYICKSQTPNSSLPSSVQFSRSVVSDSLWPHRLQHTKPPCLLPFPGVLPSSYPLNCHPTISSSVAPFSCPQSFPALESFPMSQLFKSGGQSIRASASALAEPSFKSLNASQTPNPSSGHLLFQKFFLEDQLSTD